MTANHSGAPHGRLRVAVRALRGGVDEARQLLDERGARQVAKALRSGHMAGASPALICCEFADERIEFNLLLVPLIQVFLEPAVREIVQKR